MAFLDADDSWAPDYPESNIAMFTNGVSAVTSREPLPQSRDVSEVLSNSLMEAMACGCSAISVTGSPDLIRHGETGMLFEKGSAAALANQLVAIGAGRRLAR